VKQKAAIKEIIRTQINGKCKYISSADENK
jgi:hypothetical protein